MPCPLRERKHAPDSTATSLRGRGRVVHAAPLASSHLRILRDTGIHTSRRIVPAHAASACLQGRCVAPFVMRVSWAGTNSPTLTFASPLQQPRAYTRQSALSSRTRLSSQTSHFLLARPYIPSGRPARSAVGCLSSLFLLSVYYDNSFVSWVLQIGIATRPHLSARNRLCLRHRASQPFACDDVPKSGREQELPASGPLSMSRIGDILFIERDGCRGNSTSETG